MKNKKIIFIIIVFVIGISIIIYSKNNNLNIKEKINYDYTKYPNDEIFFQTVNELYDKEISSYNFNNINPEKRVYIKVVDNEKNPIKEARVAFYDKDGNFIIASQANSNGEIAVSGFENDTIYYFKQTQTKDGLILDSKMYKMETTYTDISFSKIIINSNREITNEEKDLIIKDFENKENNKTEKFVSLQSKEQLKEKDSMQLKTYTFFMLKDKLINQKLKISAYQTIKDNDKNLKKYVLRIPNAQILNYEIENISDVENEVEILDINKNAKTSFENGECFYLRYNQNDYRKKLTYKFTITFKLNNEIYKVEKNFIIR